MALLDRQVGPLLLGASFTEAAGRELAAVAAELAQLVGWMAYDGEQHGLAQRYLIQALGLSRLAGDDGLGAEILAAMSQQAVYVARRGPGGGPGAGGAGSGAQGRVPGAAGRMLRGRGARPRRAG